MAVLTNARVVKGDQVVDGGWISWEGDRFAEIGRGHRPVDQHLRRHGTTTRLASLVAAAVRAPTREVLGAPMVRVREGRAELMGLDDVGLIARGRLANLVVLDEDLTVQAVLYRGSWVDGQTP